MPHAPTLGMPTCRICGVLMRTDKESFVKYGPTHYAHLSCFIDSGKSLTLVSPRQQREAKRFPCKPKERAE